MQVLGLEIIGWAGGEREWAWQVENVVVGVVEAALAVDLNVAASLQVPKDIAGGALADAGFGLVARTSTRILAYTLAFVTGPLLAFFGFQTQN